MDRLRSRRMSVCSVEMHTRSMYVTIARVVARATTWKRTRVALEPAIGRSGVGCAMLWPRLCAQGAGDAAGGDIAPRRPHDAVQQQAAMRVDRQVLVGMHARHHESAAATGAFDGPRHEAGFHIR